MIDVPETRYAKSGDVHIAYQIVGDGPIDVVFVGEWFMHLEMQWEEPRIRHVLERFTSFSRLILLDPRGTGLSDPVGLGDLPTLEEWMDDIRVVLDAARSERAALVATGGGGPMTVLFAATYPERVSSLVLVNTFARIRHGEEFPVGFDLDTFEGFLRWMEPRWGSGAVLDATGPSAAHDTTFREWHGRLERSSVSPGSYAALLRVQYGLDLRPVLPMVSAPTLVLHRSGSPFVPVELGRHLADGIGGATFVELPGEDYLFYTGETDPLFDEVEEFLTGVRHGARSNRVLSTVMFTDMVGSTERATELGDRHWRDLVESHHDAVRRQLRRFEGREIDTAGDGFFATFDGPARGIRCAGAIRDTVRAVGVDLRIGLHTGECELIGEKVGGIAAHIGARVMAQAGPGEVLVSRTVVDLVAGSGIQFADRGQHTLKGVPGEWQLYAVAD